jgi:hypothetical protein
MIDPVSITTILSSLLPSIGYAFKRIVDYKTGGRKPSNSSEEVASREADVKLLEAIAKLDAAEGASKWVVNVRAMQRPLVVFVVLINWTLMTLGIVPVDLQMYVIVANLASSVMFYLFGDRTLMYSLQSYNKQLTK